MQSILDLRHLKTLAALRDTGNLSRAAQWLNLTQSALSHQIKLLESSYNTALFERKSQPLRLTAAGERLVLLADVVLAQVQAAERDVARLVGGGGGQLRIAVECHTCFDWLMPAMDAFRLRWPEVEMDIVSGFHADPAALLHQRRADLAIVSERDDDDGAVHFLPLFSFEMVALVNHGHRLVEKSYLRAADFAQETLITYPVPDDMLDLMRQVLIPAQVAPAARRTTELTAAMLQLVASGRGVACLPIWAVTNYLERGYVASKSIGKNGLTARLFAGVRTQDQDMAYLRDFVDIVREQCFTHLPGIALM